MKKLYNKLKKHRNIFIVLGAILIILCLTLILGGIESNSEISVSDFEHRLVSSDGRNIEHVNSIITEKPISNILFIENSVFYIQENCNTVFVKKITTGEEIIIDIPNKITSSKFIELEDYVVLIVDGKRIYKISKESGDIVFSHHSINKIYYENVIASDTSLIFISERFDNFLKKRITIFNGNTNEVYKEKLESSGKIVSAEIHNNVFVYTFTGSNIYARSMENCQLLWKYVIEKYSQTKEKNVIINNEIYKKMAGSLRKFDLHSGKQTIINDEGNVNLLNVDGDNLYFVRPEGNISPTFYLNSYSVSKESISLNWSINIDGFPSCTLFNEMLLCSYKKQLGYSNSNPGFSYHILEIAENSGQVLWDLETQEDDEIKEIKQYNDIVIIETDSKKLYLVDKKKGDLLASITDLDKKYFQEWMIYDSFLFVFNGGNVVRLYDMSSLYKNNH